MTRLKVVGKVTEEEKGEIQQLFERRNGLNELAKILTADNTELYEKLVSDLGESMVGQNECQISMGRYRRW